MYAIPPSQFMGPPAGPHGGMAPFGGGPPPGAPPSLYGTERDKLNCAFFIKTGACRHGDKCSKFHPRPESSVTILIPMFYLNMSAHHVKDTSNQSYQYTRAFIKSRFEEFYEDVWMTLMEYGEIEEIVVCRNTCDQLLGNVYIKFTTDAHARSAMKFLKSHTFEGRLILPEFSPVHDFGQARCKDDTDGGQCRMREKDLCNYLHTESPSAKVVQRCLKAQVKFWKRKREEAPESRAGPRGTPLGRPGAPEGNDTSCYMCGEAGHIAKDCPLKRK